VKRPRVIKNVAASVRQRLYNRSREQGEDFDLTLSRYAVERFLYRLSRSPYVDDFVLKGAHLFSLWTGSPHRITRDLDVLSKGAPDILRLETIFQAVCGQPVEEQDGIDLLADSVTGEEIRAEAEYQGIRMRLAYTLAGARGTLQVDVGFGNAVTPAPALIEYPSLLDLPTPRLRAYPRETVVAEKYQALVMLGMGNSRMKDFYDLFVLASHFPFEGVILTRAIAATFKRRKTALPEQMALALTPDFARDPIKQRQWSGFLNRGRLGSTPPDLEAVINGIRTFLLPPTLALVRKEQFEWTWSAGGPWMLHEKTD